MDEMEQTVQVLSEVADISQRLDILSMMFFITVIVIFVGLLVFVAFWRFASANAQSDNAQNSGLLRTLNDNTQAFRDALEIFRTGQRVYWKQNSIEHNKHMQVARRQLAVSERLLRGLNQTVVILEASNLLDTKEVKAIKSTQSEDNLNI
jgi:hypothetical protein